MSNVLVYGKEHTFLDCETGILYRNSLLSQTASLHSHTFYEVFLVVSGEAYHLVNNSVQLIKKGDFVFIRPQDVHCYEFYISDTFRIFNLGFSTQLFTGTVQYLEASAESKSLCNNVLPPSIHLSDTKIELIAGLFETIGKAQQDVEKNRQKSANVSFASERVIRLTKVVLAQILLEFIEKADKGEVCLQQNFYSDWFDAVVLEMKKTQNFKQGLYRMILLAGCSKNHLCRVCKKKLGCSPTEFINKRRLIYASYLLSCTDEDVLTISVDCGFNNVSHFFHLF